MVTEEQNYTEPVLRVTDEARRFIIEAKQGEEDADNLALYLEVTGKSGDQFQYSMWFEGPEGRRDGDIIIGHDDLDVVIPAASVSSLQGATLDVQDSSGEYGLVLVNPNTPPSDKPDFLRDLDTESDIARQVQAVLEEQVNPQIAAHGGRADLVGLKDKVAYLRLSGGCQGCGLAAVTLSQGIVVAIKEMVPEIEDVVDVTAHQDGQNPYYQAAKK
ncbi:MAG: NifU family protein [Firmicutes bacterium]|jgi:Fe/S biogenesis protein NfuA|nr:NifU family protein [Bacillota bacterium]